VTADKNSAPGNESPFLQQSASLDPATATQAWLNSVPQDKREKSDAYFEGGYWLLLWNFLLGLAIAVFLLAGRRAARMRDWAGRVGRKPFLRDALFGALYAVAAWALSLPLTIYQGYFREHQYAMATQSFGPWFMEQLTGLAVSVVLLALVTAVFYAVLRRVGAAFGDTVDVVAGTTPLDARMRCSEARLEIIARELLDGRTGLGPR